MPVSVGPTPAPAPALALAPAPASDSAPYEIVSLPLISGGYCRKQQEVQIPESRPYQGLREWRRLPASIQGAQCGLSKIKSLFISQIQNYLASINFYRNFLYRRVKFSLLHWE